MNALAARAAMIASAALCLLLPAHAAPPQGQQKIALVTVVAEASGPLRDLTAKDFTVTEDGKKRDVVSAELATDPMSIVLLVDSTKPPMGAIPPTQDLRTALSNFVKTVQTQNQGVMIAMTEFAGAAVPRVGFDKPGDLEAAIGRLYPNQQERAVLLEALVDAGKLIGKQPPPRRAIVSVDFNSQEGSDERTMRSAFDEVRKVGATLWAVSVRGTAQSTPTREEVLNKIVQNNGGLRLTTVDSPGLDTNLKIVANSLASQYTITFTRPDGGTPKTVVFETARGAKVQKTNWMR
jgi:hypothetical protein